MVKDRDLGKCSTCPLSSIHPGIFDTMHYVDRCDTASQNLAEAQER